MSCKILRGPAAAAAERTEWQRAPGEGIDSRAAWRPRRLDADGNVLDSGEPSPMGEKQPAKASGPPAMPAVNVDAIRKEAFQAGFGEGEQAGEQKVRNEMRERISQLGRTVHDLAVLKSKLRAEAERDLVDLALAVAKKIVRRHVSADPATVLAIVRACLEEYSRVEMRRLRVSPQDLPLVEEYFQKNPISGLKIESDPAVSAGGAVFETNQGEIDARIETQFREIEHGLADL